MKRIRMSLVLLSLLFIMVVGMAMALFSSQTSFAHPALTSIQCPAGETVNSSGQCIIPATAQAKK